jgi:hypothetical protein
MQTISKPDPALPLQDFWLIVCCGNSEKQPAVPLFSEVRLPEFQNFRGEEDIDR